MVWRDKEGVQGHEHSFNLLETREDLSAQKIMQARVRLCEVGGQRWEGAIE